MNRISKYKMYRQKLIWSIIFLIFSSLSIAQSEPVKEQKTPKRIKSAEMSQDKKSKGGTSELTGSEKSKRKDRYNKKKEGRKQAREQRKREKEYKKSRKKQQNVQTTRRMKKSERKAKKNNSGKKGNIFQRTFRKKK